MQTLLRKFKDYWTREWAVKLISLCIAALLWYLVGGQDMVEKTVMVPVEVINLPKSLTISNKYKKEIEVSVRGPRTLLLEMGQNQSPRQIDLSKAQPGTHVEAIENSSIPVMRGVDVLRVQPSSIILSLDKLVEREYQIKAVTDGEIPDGYILKDLKLDPMSIHITGPQTVLSQVRTLQTVPINIQGLTESMQLQIPLQLDPAIVDLIGETSVTADITIGYETIEKTIENIPVRLTLDGFIRKVDPAAVTVKMSIPRIAIKKNMDFGKLITVTAIPVENSDVYRIKVVPSDMVKPPPEIISVEPLFVSMVAEPQEQKMQPQEQGDEKNRSGTKEAPIVIPATKEKKK